MKQITQPITDVDVELITFHEENVYETFTNALQARCSGRSQPRGSDCHDQGQASHRFLPKG